MDIGKTTVCNFHVRLEYYIEDYHIWLCKWGMSLTCGWFIPNYLGAIQDKVISYRSGVTKYDPVCV